MTFNFKTIAAAAAIAVLGTTASAGLIDFTDDTTGASGTIDGIGWTLTVIPGPLNQSETGPEGAAGTEPLVGDNDGIGIIDDEISFPRQYALLEFTDEVTIVTTYWLDLFVRADEQSAEVGFGESNLGDSDSYIAYAPDGVNYGFGAFATSLTGTGFIFYVGETNDGNANPDAALAALEIAPVPLPAGILLLGGALAGLGIARRRK